MESHDDVEWLEEQELLFPKKAVLIKSESICVLRTGSAWTISRDDVSEVAKLALPNRAQSIAAVLIFVFYFIYLFFDLSQNFLLIPAVGIGAGITAFMLRRYQVTATLTNGDSITLANDISRSEANSLRDQLKHWCGQASV